MRNYLRLIPTNSSIPILPPYYIRKEPHDGGSNRCSNCSDSCFCARFCFSLVELTKIICKFNLDPVHFQPHRVPGTVWPDLRFFLLQTSNTFDWGKGIGVHRFVLFTQKFVEFIIFFYLCSHNDYHWYKRSLTLLTELYLIQHQHRYWYANGIVNSWQNRIIYNLRRRREEPVRVVISWQNRIIYNVVHHWARHAVVVNGWQNRIIYISWKIRPAARLLWIVDKIVSYTTDVKNLSNLIRLWMADKIVSYTTVVSWFWKPSSLWMADKIVSYTTATTATSTTTSCEWLTKSYHIQPVGWRDSSTASCEWLTKSYHIQQTTIKFLFISLISKYSHKKVV